MTLLKRSFFFLTALLMFTAPLPVLAQSQTPSSGPVYIIQTGDSLSLVASRFGITLADLLTANNISDANSITVGQQIIIPGLEGISGVLTTQVINYGDTLHSLSRSCQISEAFLRKLNHITSPSELYAGVGLVLPQQEDAAPLSARISLSAGETLLEAAVRENSDPWTLEQVNSLNGTWAALPGDVFYSPTETATTSKQGGMPPAFENVNVSPLPMTQGGTSEIIIQTQPGVSLGGMLVDKPLHFFPLEENKYVALEGIHAMLDPGAYPLQIEATLPDGTKQTYEQMVVIQSGYYPNDPLLVVDPETIDPTVTDPEQAQLQQITTPATSTRYWQGLFQSPAFFPDCFTSRYGNRRVYQGQGTDIQITSFHSGLDFCGGEGLPITAPADGIVVFAGPLIVRGNATIIDHGWGIYSGFWHQSKIDVTVGQIVKKGEKIGEVGGTGRVTGAHQHWEVWVNGIQVNPMNWLNNVYP